MAAAPEEMTNVAGPGLYVHVPFCARVCPYCDFAVRTGGAAAREQYVRALLDEIEWWWGRRGSRGDDAAMSARPAATPSQPAGRGGNPPLSRFPADTAFDSVYLGGGTPSALSTAALGTILEALRQRMPLAGDLEVTLEANPEDVDAAALNAWRELGITRLSLGMQSFDARALKMLGRAHDPEQAVTATRLALDAGFDAVSVDLIFAVPGQDEEAWRATLQQAVDLGPDHVSCYELTVHEGTPFFRARAQGRLIEVADDRKADLFFATHEMLAAAGYPAYEVSNFAREPRRRSRHNSKYWRHAPYLGIGPSAHSFDGESRRWWNVRDLDGWRRALAEGAPVAGTETLSSSELAFEALALGLRTVDGVDLVRIEERWGLELETANRALIDDLSARGLLEPGTDGCLVPTRAGLAVADTLATAFELGAVSAVAAPHAG